MSIFYNLGADWNLNNLNGIKNPQFIRYHLIDNQPVLIVPCRGNSTIKFFKRTDSGWIDMGNTWNLTNIGVPRSIVFDIIDGKQVLGIVDISGIGFSSTIRFYERVNNAWTLLPPNAWSLSGFSFAENVLYKNIGKLDVLVVAERFKNKIRFFSRSEGRWVEQIDNWTLSENLNNPVGLRCRVIDGTQVLIVGNYGDSTIRFYEKIKTGWVEKPWSLNTYLNGPHGINFSKINGLDVLSIVNQNGDNNCRFYSRIDGNWVHEDTWQLVTKDGIVDPIGLIHTIIQDKHLLAISNESNDTISFFENRIKKGDEILMLDTETLSLPPPVSLAPLSSDVPQVTESCEVQNVADIVFNLNWALPTGNSADIQNAIISFTNNKNISDFPQTGSILNLIAPVATSDYKASLVVKDKYTTIKFSCLKFSINAKIYKD